MSSSSSSVTHRPPAKWRPVKKTAVIKELNDPTVHRIRQFLQPVWLQQGVLADAFATGSGYPILAPNLTLCPGLSAFTAMFDQYRIVNMEVFFYPNRRAGVVASAPLANVQPPAVCIVADYDDQNVPSLFTQLLEYQNSHMMDPYKPWQTSIVPRSVIGSSNGNSFPQAPSTWIDIASASQAHYGIKIGITGGAYAQTELWAMQVSVRLTIDFKQVR